MSNNCPVCGQSYPIVNTFTLDDLGLSIGDPVQLVNDIQIAGMSLPKGMHGKITGSNYEKQTILVAFGLPLTDRLGITWQMTNGQTELEIGFYPSEIKKEGVL